MNRSSLAAMFFACAALLVHGCSSDTDRAPALGIWDFGDAGKPETKDPKDLDGDWYIPPEDCNETNALINPGAFEYVGNNLDDDCDGEIDNGYADCDNGSLDATNPFDFAKAMNICPEVFLVDAAYKIAAKDSQHRIALHWGPNISSTFGSTLGVMSTGLTLLPGEPGFKPTDPGTDHGMKTKRPGPYANKAPCPAATGTEVYDPADILLTLRAPTNAQAFSFQVRFFTAEYPNYYCNNFNDAFAAMLKSQQHNNKNIAFGSEGENLSVNVSFWKICEPIETYKGCEEPTTTIAGSGFEGHGATRWLTVTAPVIPGEQFTLRLVVWDEGDGILDSTVLVDNFKWDINPAEISTIEQPK